MWSKNHSSDEGYNPVSKDNKSCQSKEKLTVKEYRELLNDYKSTEEQIKKRLDYLEAFCHNVVQMEVEKVLQGSKKKRKA